MFDKPAAIILIKKNTKSGFTACAINNNFLKNVHQIVILKPGMQLIFYSIHDHVCKSSVILNLYNAENAGNAFSEHKEQKTKKTDQQNDAL